MPGVYPRRPVRDDPRVPEPGVEGDAGHPREEPRVARRELRRFPRASKSLPPRLHRRLGERALPAKNVVVRVDRPIRFVYLVFPSRFFAKKGVAAEPRLEPRLPERVGVRRESHLAADGARRAQRVEIVQRDARKHRDFDVIRKRQETRCARG